MSLAINALSADTVRLYQTPARALEYQLEIAEVAVEVQVAAEAVRGNSTFTGLQHAASDSEFAAGIALLQADDDFMTAFDLLTQTLIDQLS